MANAGLAMACRRHRVLTQECQGGTCTGVPWRGGEGRQGAARAQWLDGPRLRMVGQARQARRVLLRTRRQGMSRVLKARRGSAHGKDSQRQPSLGTAGSARHGLTRRARARLDMAGGARFVLAAGAQVRLDVAGEARRGRLVEVALGEAGYARPLFAGRAADGHGRRRESRCGTSG